MCFSFCIRLLAAAQGVPRGGNLHTHTRTGTVKPTPTVWLAILANIAPPQLRRTAAADKEWKKLSNPLNNLPIQRGLNPPTRPPEISPPHLDG
ncbi:hypothetical protein JTB14_006324 [Gonioctena quinquepunctata]|nr:hypothetical protein JTB14_006324 [Gonioctena quinquepunctata]